MLYHLLQRSVFGIKLQKQSKRKRFVCVWWGRGGGVNTVYVGLGGAFACLVSSYTSKIHIVFCV